ncbi:uncharacterized protein Tco025E_02793 [Trypanosoma conorhini]|uniref:Uncharacterized protein n=1 Tax=Trypanosoma conorhini TaxID=83891 RepID=A0A3R7NU18_9TRYP|nr:uncharacterized protein Tco025E_02793 [Trypanosoma conorhini]RNF23501.1 hypothetical protein Tco025E_02793 [Trypanosoma conorhini]
MGAVPSRETLQRGLYVVRAAGGGGVGCGGKRQEIVLIPLTKEFFPSPDCALFVQFHRTRCDAGVNYYFRRPGNPGDLSRIPATDNSDGESSYPSREALYRGVVERVEEMLFDTDEEMRQAHERAAGLTTPESGAGKKRVLPIICAVAFRYDPSKLAQQNGILGAGCPQQLQMAMEQGVYLCGSIVNIVGCFGFVPMEVEGAAVPASAGSQAYCSATSPPRAPPSVPRSQTRTSAAQSPAAPPRNRHEDPFALSAGHHPRPALPRSALAAACSLASSPSYDPHQPAPQQQRPRVPVPAGLIQLGGIAGSNYDHFVSLPPPLAAAPLAAIVFLTKSAGEQNLSRITFMAAGMYYNQLIDAGLLQRPAKQTMHSPYYAKPCMPPMDTFSFSSLMTNVPILSFLHEMRCRMGHVGVDPHLGGSQHSRTSSLDSSTSTLPAIPAGFTEPAGFETWITEDNMLHGRIGKQLAERLCLALAERPDIFARRVEPLPSGDAYWRFRGLVDRHRPPPLPLSEGGTTPVDDRDVYVMGAAVMDGFDEGDVLRYDAEVGLWVADRSIPLDAVVLAAMRPHCKAAREAPPEDPGWVTTTQALQEGDVDDDGDDNDAAAEEAEQQAEGSRGGSPQAKRVDAAAGAGERRRHRRVHVREGNFYIYRFELNGKTYYHGTVPDFANPNKRSAHGAALSAVPRRDAAAAAKPAPPPSAGPSGAGAGERRGEKAGSRRPPPSITSALFSLAPDGASDAAQEGGVAYLPTRVTSTALDTAKRWMGALLQYAANPRQAFAGAGAGVAGEADLRSPRLISPLGASTPLTRRQPTFVEVGPDAVQTAAPQHAAAAAESTGFVKRFVHETRYVWDWRRS